jgi:hypothetical protein
VIAREATRQPVLIPSGARADDSTVNAHVQAATAPPRLRTVLLCHHDAPIHVEGISRWLGSWSDLTGVVIIREPSAAIRRRMRREWRRVGTLRFLDVVALRLWYRLLIARRDDAWLRSESARLVADHTPWREPERVYVSSPNSPDSETFIQSARPDLVVALCKSLLAERIFTIPRHGTFVMHPGICPEYRNAHGCFWALASDDVDRVGLSLIRIDKGIDTGPVFGYFKTTFDESTDSHIRIQHGVLLDNLAAIEQRLLDVVAGRAQPIDTTGRQSREWGQPWLSAWWRWKRQARRRHARSGA